MSNLDREVLIHGSWMLISKYGGVAAFACIPVLVGLSDAVEQRVMAPVTTFALWLTQQAFHPVVSSSGVKSTWVYLVEDCFIITLCSLTELKSLRAKLALWQYT